MSIFLRKDGITLEVAHVVDVQRLKKAGYQEIETASLSSSEQGEELDDLTVIQLKDLAREQDLEGFSTLNKADLIELIKGGE